jgi:hypothetical protein
MTLALQSTLTCPDCGTQTVETMPTNACVYFHTCEGCGSRLKPRPGDCCVFCSYGSVPCPPVQQSGKNACCATVPENAAPGCCSLQPGAFRQRIAEIAGLMRAFHGSVERTPKGMALHFKAEEGLRATLDALAEKERSCCATLEFTITEQGGSVAFRIDGADEDRAAIDDLAARLEVVQATAALRDNVHRPDWAKVTLPNARDVLQRRLLSHPAGLARWEALDAGEDKALIAILGRFAQTGHAPSTEDVAGAIHQSVDETRRAIDSLRLRDLVVLDKLGASIVAAYPFTGASTAHRVTLGGQTVHSLCAIDALGAGAMFGADASIESTCAHCGTAVHVTLSRGGVQLETVEPADAVVWYTLLFDGCAAENSCPSTVFFCSDDHLASWRAGQGARAAGERLSMAEALEIGIALFEPLLRQGACRSAAVDGRLTGASSGLG